MGKRVLCQLEGRGREGGREGTYGGKVVGEIRLLHVAVLVDRRAVDVGGVHKAGVWREGGKEGGREGGREGR